jgi:ribosome-associated heat shock protein Hsp15
MANEIRIDKWLWAARVFKTRTVAAEACKKGRVSQGNLTLKPSRLVKVGDVIDVRKPPVTFRFKILQAVGNRVGAKLVPDVLENLTSPDQLDLLLMNRLNGRQQGTGRPTKKDRRDLDQYTTENLERPIWEDYEDD